MQSPSLSAKSYLLAYVTLLALLGANVAIGHLNLGWGSMFIAVAIAAMQGAVIALIMMHGLFENVFIKLIMGAALLWFTILITLTFTDYITRNWLPIPGK